EATDPKAHLSLGGRHAEKTRLLTGPPNDCRISCNAASHATKTAARFLRRFENGFAESAPPRSADCNSRPLGRRANKRRVVSFLQRLAGPTKRTRSPISSLYTLGRVGAKIIDPTVPYPTNSRMRAI